MISNWKKRFGFSILGVVIFGMFVLPGYLLQPITMAQLIMLGLGTLIGIAMCLSIRSSINRIHISTIEPKFKAIRGFGIGAIIVLFFVLFQWLGKDFTGLLIIALLIGAFEMCIYATVFLWRNRPH